MNSLTESYTEGMNGTPHGRIPPNMLLCDPRKGHEKYIWYNPPQKEKCTFNPVCTSLTEPSMFRDYLCGGTGEHGRPCLQGNSSPGTDGALPGTVLQCNRSGCLSGELGTGKTAGHRFFRLPGILGETFLA